VVGPDDGPDRWEPDVGLEVRLAVALLLGVAEGLTVRSALGAGLPVAGGLDAGVVDSPEGPTEEGEAALPGSPVQPAITSVLASTRPMTPRRPVRSRPT
jgi:hypothetical protein